MSNGIKRSDVKRKAQLYVCVDVVENIVTAVKSNFWCEYEILCMQYAVR